MSRFWRSLAIVGIVAGLGSACAAPTPAPPRDLRVMLTPDAGVYADAPHVVPGTLLEASLRLVNPSPQDRPVVQTTDWIDAAGLIIQTLLSTPQRLTVPRYGDAVIRVIAPTPAAVQFRIRVEPDLSAIDPS